MVDLGDSVIARYKDKNHIFEILVDCEKAMAYKKGEKVDISSLVFVQNIFDDVKKGIRSSDNVLTQIFGTLDFWKIADKIVKKGDIQLTTEYKTKIREQIRKRIIDLLHKNCIDVKTGRPHPPQRIENALNDVKINIDENKPADVQIQNIIKQLQTILPIKFELRQLSIIIGAKYAGSSYNTIKKYGKILKEEWNNDGSIDFIIEIPAGMQEEFEITLNNLAHGQIEMCVMEKK